MPSVKTLGRVMVPVNNQDAGIAFYTGKLGFTVAADVPFGNGERWVEVAPPAGGATLALVPPQGEYQPGRMTGVALDADDARAVYEDFKGAGVDVDDELMGGDGTVPALFFFRDHDGNQLMVVESA